MKLKKDEEKLIGGYWMDGKTLKLDEVSLRIRELINNHLLQVSTAESGWNVLYKDQQDGRFWELVYLESQMQGGGAPSLIHLTETEAKMRYKTIS